MRGSHSGVDVDSVTDIDYLPVDEASYPKKINEYMLCYHCGHTYEFDDVLILPQVPAQVIV